MLALALRQKSLNRFTLFPFRQVSSSSLLLSSLELSDTKVYESEIRSLLGTRCDVAVTRETHEVPAGAGKKRLQSFFQELAGEARDPEGPPTGTRVPRS